MKNKILYLAFCAAGLLTTTSCEDYLETSSKSNADANFVFSNMTTARAAMDGAYAEWHGAISSHIFGDGLFYAFDIAGSDIMRHPEKYEAQLPRHVPETFYNNGELASTYDAVQYGKEAPSNAYSVLFSVIGKANAIASAIESTSGYAEMMEQKQPTDLSQLYGEAIALRATAYRELIKYYGDIPYVSEMGKPAGKLMSRDAVYEMIIADLQKVEPLMRPVGATKNTFSKTYVNALIGRIALEAGGYQTRRGDIAPVDAQGEPVTIETVGTENNGATYGRRSDWREFYAIAKTHFQNAINAPGTAKFHMTDPRTEDKEGRVYGNPYQYFFQQLHGADASYADESIYEEPFTQGASGNDPRSYSLGRPSGGGGSNAYPCKAYGQGRINPAFYYGVFDPADLRRDVSCAVTGSNGKGVEAILPFTPGSTIKGGGISCNKFDENRQAEPWVAKQRRSGINAPYMRMSEVYLGLAEACAALGEDATAKEYLTKVRTRAFGSEAKADVNGFIAKSGSLLKAIIDERGFEFAGEGDRRFTLIRTGLLNEKIQFIKNLTAKMIEGLKTNGSYTFDNGNTISAKVWTKNVDAKSIYKYRLTAQCPAGMENDPVLYPSWRGQHDDWAAMGLDYGTDTPATNLAIKGLFTALTADEIAVLEADGYKATAWGSAIVDNEKEYSDYLFYKYDYNKAPIYLFPFSPNVMSTGGFTNGYGFANND
jgi:hypothetical protein